MHGTYNRPGFSLIEIMVALTIMALLAAIISPNFRRRQPEYERQQFLGHLNALMRIALQQAVVMQKLHRVYFDFKNKKITVQIKGEGKDQKGEHIFMPIKAPYLHHTLTVPKNFSIEQFFIEGTDEFKREGQAWFFIMPEGLAQDVIINIIDKNKAYRDKPKKIGLVLNPFTAQFKVYDSFQK